MYKGTIDLGSINDNLKMKFNLILKNDDNNTKVISTYTFGNYNGLKINPVMYITLDISKTSDKNDSWNNNLNINLNRQQLFLFIRKLKEFIESYKEKDLYYYKDGKLILNKEIANKNVFKLKTTTKALAMLQVVVPDKENKEVEYEGCVLAINSLDNFCYLTYFDLEYLYYQLSRLDLYNLSMMLINTDLLLKGKNINLDHTNYNKTINEDKEKNIEENIPQPKITDTRIPNL